MKEYQRWYIKNGDNIVYSGGITGLLNKYNLTKEQFWNMVKFQNFPYGELTSRKDYYDYTIEKSFDFHNKNMVCYMNSLCRKAFIGMLDEYDTLDACVKSVMDNEYEIPNFKLFEKMAKIAFKLEKIVIKMYDNPDRDSSKIIFIRLPMKEYPSSCFVISSYSLESGHNQGYKLIKDIFEEIHKLLNEPSQYIGKIIYRGTSGWNSTINSWTKDKTSPSSEEVNLDMYKTRRDYSYNTIRYVNTLGINI